jgi:hypothetical protein
MKTVKVHLRITLMGSISASYLVARCGAVKRSHLTSVADAAPAESPHISALGTSPMQRIPAGSPPGSAGDEGEIEDASLSRLQSKIVIYIGR